MNAMSDTVTRLNSENQLTVQTKGSRTEWITINADVAMRLEQ
jgi:hypothetical protein